MTDFINVCHNYAHVLLLLGFVVLFFCTVLSKSVGVLDHRRRVLQLCLDNLCKQRRVRLLCVPSVTFGVCDQFKCYVPYLSL